MSEQAIRVLHVLGALNPGGVETWLMHVLRHIDRDRFQPDFCLFGKEKGVYALDAEQLGSRVILCPARPGIWTLGRRFRRILREGNYDVVHSHVHHFSGAVLRSAKAEGVPRRIAHCHSTGDGKGSGPSRILYRRLMKHWIRKYATHGLAASAEAAAALFGPNWQSDPRFRVLHCGIDLEPFWQDVSREAVRQELGIPPNAPVVGHVGRFAPAKNHAFLLDIAAEVIKRRPEVYFLLVGDGPLRPDIEAKARHLGIEKNVIFAGVRADVPRLMLGAMDLFVFPSLWEGLGIVLVEAQAAGLRCVCSDAVPPEAVVVPDAVRYVRLSAGAGEWAAVVLRTLEYGRLREAGALELIAKGDFNVQKSCQDLIGLYGQVAGRGVTSEKADA
jgi:glycosyltransferase involved in cell wall biosynthesis